MRIFLSLSRLIIVSFLLGSTTVLAQSVETFDCQIPYDRLKVELKKRANSTKISEQNNLLLELENDRDLLAVLESNLNGLSANETTNVVKGRPINNHPCYSLRGKLGIEDKDHDITELSDIEIRAYAFFRDPSFTDVKQILRVGQNYRDSETNKIYFSLAMGRFKTNGKRAYAGLLRHLGDEAVYKNRIVWLEPTIENNERKVLEVVLCDGPCTEILKIIVPKNSDSRQNAEKSPSVTEDDEVREIIETDLRPSVPILSNTPSGAGAAPQSESASSIIEFPIVNQKVQNSKGDGQPSEKIGILGTELKLVFVQRGEGPELTTPERSLLREKIEFTSDCRIFESIPLNSAVPHQLLLTAFENCVALPNEDLNLNLSEVKLMQKEVLTLVIAVERPEKLDGLAGNDNEIVAADTKSARINEKTVPTPLPLRLNSFRLKVKMEDESNLDSYCTVDLKVWRNGALITDQQIETVTEIPLDEKEYEFDYQLPQNTFLENGDILEYQLQNRKDPRITCAPMSSERGLVKLSWVEPATGIVEVPVRALKGVGNPSVVILSMLLGSSLEDNNATANFPLRGRQQDREFLEELYKLVLKNLSDEKDLRILVASGSADQDVTQVFKGDARSVKIFGTQGGSDNGKLTDISQEIFWQGEFKQFQFKKQVSSLEDEFGPFGNVIFIGQRGLPRTVSYCDNHPLYSLPVSGRNRTIKIYIAGSSHTDNPPVSKLFGGFQRMPGKVCPGNGKDQTLVLIPAERKSNWEQGLDDIIRTMLNRNPSIAN